MYMWEFLLNLLKVNEEINYSLIVAIVFSYFFLIWLVICIWVYFDARKRYVSGITCVCFALFVLVFGPPALMFYIMIRPEHTIEEEYYINLALSGEKESKPIYFDGDKGFDISINLSVQPRENDKGQHRMDMRVEWYPHPEKKVQKINKPFENMLKKYIGEISRLFGNFKLIRRKQKEEKSQKSDKKEDFQKKEKNFKKSVKSKLEK